MMTTQDTAELKIIACSDCDYKSPAGVPCCPHCGSEALTESPASGRGTVYTHTMMSFVPAGPHKGRAPYVIGVIETEEGMRVTAIVEADDPANVAIGDPVMYSAYESGVGFVFRKQ